MAKTLQQIIARNKEMGLHYFQPEATAFFDSRPIDRTWEGPGGLYFVDSIQYHPSERARYEDGAKDGEREYKVVRFDWSTGRTSTPYCSSAETTEDRARTTALRFAADPYRAKLEEADALFWSVERKEFERHAIVGATCNCGDCFTCACADVCRYRTPERWRSIRRANPLREQTRARSKSRQ